MQTNRQTDKQTNRQTDKQTNRQTGPGPNALPSHSPLGVRVLLLAAPTWLRGHCGKHNSPPASSVVDFIFRRSDGSHISIDTVHPSLFRSSSFSSPRWYHLQSLSSDVVLVSPLYLAKPPQSCFPAPLCDVLYLPQ